jgi:hypothetical protein
MYTQLTFRHVYFIETDSQTHARSLSTSTHFTFCLSTFTHIETHLLSWSAMQPNQQLVVRSDVQGSSNSSKK